MQFVIPKTDRPYAKHVPATPLDDRRTNENHTILLSSPKNPSFKYYVPSCTSTTSVSSLKSALSKAKALPVDKIRILYKKRPVTDSKVLKDFLSPDELMHKSTIELGVMVMGGVAVAGDPSIAMLESSETTNHGQRSTEADANTMLQGDDFWHDLHGFLAQRLKDDKVSNEFYDRCKIAWLRGAS